MTRKIIDLDAERISINAAAKRLGLHVGSIFRWASRGVRGRKLPTILVGGRRFVLVSDLEEMLSAINSESTSPVARPMSPNQRAEAAERELDRILGSESAAPVRTPITEQRLRDEGLLPPTPDQEPTATKVDADAGPAGEEVGMQQP